MVKGGQWEDARNRLYPEEGGRWKHQSQAIPINCIETLLIPICYCLGETWQNNHWSVAARYLGEDRSGKDWIFILVDSANSTDVLNDTKTILDVYTSLHFE